MADTLIAPRDPGPTDHHDRIVFGVRWTDARLDVEVHTARDAHTALTLAATLRALQTRDHRIPDAHVVTRRMRGTTPLSEWTAR
ncbi:hypothetical protein ACTD5D_00365 [Nocardia takedensis]|uniref:hypothetical protein n=1 Tax=Nocardia takedensis TaxID=259390 RepID=UPI003F75A3B0